jgi:glycosyltransferase involved in cell wall biosynthesis
MKLFTQFLGRRRLARVRPPVPPVARLAVTTQPVFGPWGGGNQWLLQFSRYMHYAGYEVVHDLRAGADAVIIQHNGLSGAMSFGFDEIAAARRANPRLRVIHRINDNDIRKNTTEMDALMARYNTLADYTVFISEWLRDHHAAKWFDRARPHACILNGADPSVFHPVGSPTWRGEKSGEPFRFVTHHWADNPMKGFPRYAELDDLVARGELPGVELWVIGRWPRDLVWKSARTFPPCAGPDLAALLRQCHGYLTASLWEPGGMHFIEGLQCGLPIAFHEDGGGIPELARRYGVGFRDDLADAVRSLMKDYAGYREKVLTHPPSGDGMCLAYREIIQRVLAER